MTDASPASGTAPDAGLVERLRTGDEASFRELVGTMHGALRRLALAYVGSAAAADEVVQETWLAVVAQLDGFEGRSSLRTWIATILVNRAKTRGARDKRTVPFSALSAEDVEPVEPDRFTKAGFWDPPPTRWEDAPDALLARKQAVKAVGDELARMPEAQRTVVTLRDVEGWSSEEVCNALGLSETNQRVLLHRGRQRLRVALERHQSEADR